MNRQQTDRVGPLLLRDGFELTRADRLLLGNEPHEALDVGSAQLLVGARQPCELAHVGVAAATVPLRERREVVVVLGDDGLEQPFERQNRSEPSQPLVALVKRTAELRVLGR
jgi:hypothetical protein